MVSKVFVEIGKGFGIDCFFLFLCFSIVFSWFYLFSLVFIWFLLLFDQKQIKTIETQKKTNETLKKHLKNKKKGFKMFL
jgi:hypothetical protein